MMMSLALAMALNMAAMKGDALDDARKGFNNCLIAEHNEAVKVKKSAPEFNEAIVNRVLDDIVKACEPKQVVVRGKFGARGGIQLTCEARFPDSDEKIRLPE